MRRPRPRTVIVIGVVTALLVTAAAVPAVITYRNRQDADRLHQAVTGFATAWRTGRLETVGYHGVTGAQVARQVGAATAGLTAAAADLPAAVDVLGVDGPKDSAGTARLRVRWNLGQNRGWQYDTSARLSRVGGRWLVDWTPSVLHPRLAAGQVLVTSRTTPARGQIVGARGEVLVSERQVVNVGIQPSRTTDRAATVAAVAAVVDVDAAELTKRVRAAAANAFVDVITLRRTDFDTVRDRLRPIPGVIFAESTRALAPTPGFARALLGSVGPATKEIVDASRGRVRAGDVTGLSGVQRTYDARLSGTAGVTVRAVPAAGTTAAGTTAGAATAGGAGTELFTVPAVDGKPVTLSLDSTVQQAAEAALAAAPKPAGLVAVRASTGEVLAVANGGPGAAGYNRALIGRYPPGSTFKVATTFALLQAGITPETPVACPPTINVGGRVFSNAEAEKLGTVPFRTDFAQSCNTAFIGSARRISAQQLHDAAAALGYGATNTLGVTAYTGDVPGTAAAVEHAADAIGQGTVLASPLTVAVVSASVAAGRFLPPRLVLDAAGPGTASPAAGATPTDPSAAGATGATGDQAGGATGDQAGGTPTGSAGSGTGSATSGSGGEGSAAGGEGTASGTPTGAAPEGTPLPAAPIAQLRSLMREVVVTGTGSALKGVPGAPVQGKTGTAEYGSANPPATHAWFTGYRGDLAFAVVVEGGGFGGKVAAPLAAAFLTRLGGA